MKCNPHHSAVNPPLQLNTVTKLESGLEVLLFKHTGEDWKDFDK